jgi:hypothetical protein
VREARIFVNYPDDAPRPYVEPGVIGRRAGPLTPFFEGEAFRDIYRHDLHLGCDYIGVLSWRCQAKTGLSPWLIQWAIEHDPEEPDYFCADPAPQAANVWWKGTGDKSTAEIMEALARAILAVAGWGDQPQLADLPTPPIYYNFWAAKPAVFGDFCRTMLLPCMAAMADPQQPFRAALFGDSHYCGKLTAAQLEQRLGVPWYPYHPFIVERLFPTYAALKGLRGAAWRI